jgi:phenylacetate-coenzyme A ligase PaaK-like adenylate-forming protein
MRWVNEANLDGLLAFVADNPHSSFYSDRYAKVGVVPALGTFDRLPILSRKELTDTPVSERTFVPQSEVRFVAFTSGTSATVPLMVPFADVEDYHFEPSLGVEVSRPLIIHPPMMKSFGHTFIQQCRQARRKLSPLMGDVQNAANSALLAKLFTCDAVYGIPTTVALFAPEAARQGVAEQIKLLALTSESLTEARRAELERSFPNALIANLYGSTELGQLPFFSCPTMMRKRLNRFHVLTEALAAVELVDGELVVSYGLNKATPLVRYATGDYFEEVPEGCDCGLPGPTLAWGHRHGVDRVRLGGMEFDAEAADRVLLAADASSAYQVHFYPGEGAAVRLVVEVLDPKRSASAEGRALEARLKGELPERWRLSTSATVRTALERGLLSAFDVKVVPNLSAPSLKAKRFVNHVV